uniref:Uncharacterized protein n=1 Tax=uncultured bacterium contig00037 TaxID=1181525 RepID=A0A806KAX2_9BACT|nr:hypothetical protein [uncultured bacterium contig00037]
MTETFTWKDVKIIVQKLVEKYPDIDPYSFSGWTERGKGLPTEHMTEEQREIEREQVRTRVISLEGFNDEPYPKDKHHLITIKYEWIELYEVKVLGYEDQQTRLWKNPDYIRSEICP